MSAAELFKRADLADSVSTWILRIVVGLSIILLAQPTTQRIVEPILLVATIVGLFLEFLTRTFQNEGNRLLRGSQLANALAVPLGPDAPEGYYNNPFPPSVNRLAATTLENAIFSRAILRKMLNRERLHSGLYVCLFLFLIAFRGTSMSWILLLSQTIFSADVVGHWLRMERFEKNVARIEQRLRQFFIQGVAGKEKTKLAIALIAFSDYECAKDEAAMPLDGKTFEKLNPRLSKEWEELKTALKIE
jgi:hypothetical protein